jgi:hypothetical protein
MLLSEFRYENLKGKDHLVDLNINNIKINLKEQV